jgi:hypothetical protein
MMSALETCEQVLMPVPRIEARWLSSTKISYMITWLGGLPLSGNYLLSIQKIS